jgi:tRNA (Thr-GGU) A37 N-methylase
VLLTPEGERQDALRGVKADKLTARPSGVAISTGHLLGVNIKNIPRVKAEVQF